MSEPIRVLHVFGRLDTGGAESRTMDIYRSIDRSKVQFDFAIHTDDKCFYTNEIINLGGKIFHFPRFNGRNYLKYKKAWNYFFKKNPDYKIIHGHQTSTAFIYLKEAKKNNIPIRIAHSRNSSKDSYIKKFTCKLSRFYASTLLSVSRLAAIREFGYGTVSNGKVKIIPNAIDASKYIFNENIRQLKREEIGIQDSFAVCHIGRFHKQKNHLFLLKCFKQIHTREPRAKLILIGDGPLKSQIQNQIVQLSLENAIIMLGVRSDVPELLQAMDVLLFPSIYEGFPGVVLEAQASGLPCIISDTITTEVKLTNLVEYFSLNKSEEEWAEKALKFSNGISRKNTYHQIVKAGYDIKSISKWYQDFYISNFNKISKGVEL